LFNRGGTLDSVKLLDFGLVKDLEQTEEEATLTKQNVVAGTPAYMSPEQIADPRQLDPRTDIYSLGALAYFVFLGRPVFEGNALQVIRR
jgi:eukaryotic-like serine/threonine-protein kinase